MSRRKLQIEEKYKYYLERHNKHEKWHESLSHNLDKLIFGLSSGTLVLSITFIDKIIGLDEIQNLCLIKISWLFLSLTLIINIATYIFSIRASIKARKVLKKWLDEDTEETPETYNWRGKTANILNILSLFTLALGMFILTYFAIININTINTMNNYNQEKQTGGEGGGEDEQKECSESPQEEPAFLPPDTGEGEEKKKK